MKKNIKPLLGGASFLLMVTMILVLVSNSSFRNSQTSTTTAYVLLSNCVQLKASKPLPCPDTLASRYSLLMTEHPQVIYFCFNSPVSDFRGLKATLSGADKSMPVSASPDMYGEPVIVSGDTLYPTRVTFNLNKMPSANHLEFSLVDYNNKSEKYFTVELHMHEQK